MAAPKTLTFEELKNMNGQQVVTMRGTLNVIVEQSKCQKHSFSSSLPLYLSSSLLSHLSLAPLASSSLSHRILLILFLFIADDVYLEWEQHKARIVRPDVNAVNGVIHLIDNVLMLKRDLASAAPASISPSICVLSALLLTVFASFGIL